MSYLFPLCPLIVLVILNGISTISPLIFSFWFSSFTSFIIYLLSPDSSTSSVTLLLVEESLSIWSIWMWILLGGGMPLFILLMVNGGLAPLHKWLLEVLTGINTVVIVWALTLHNIPLILLLSSVVSWQESIVLFLSFALGVLLILKISDVRIALILSSSNNLAFITILISSDLLRGGLFLIFYILILWSSWIISEESVDSIFILFGVSGVPPFIIFQLKWIVLESIIKSSIIIPLLLITMAGGASVVYIRIILTLDSNYPNSSISFLTLWALISAILPTV